MGDSSDGPSSAAHRAQEESDQSHGAVRTLLNFILGLDRSDEHDAEDDRHFGLNGFDDARDMLINVRKMSGVRIEDIAVPRADIVAVPDTATLEEVVQVFRDTSLTRLPVYSETLDNPLGMIHLKDLALRFGFGAKSEEFVLRDLMRPLLYAPPSMRMGVLLQQMQNVRGHMALVIDEYGGVDGLVTMEDIVEQIIGDVADEHDTDEGPLWIEESPGCFIAQSRAPLEEFAEAAGVGFDPEDLDDDIDTLGGLVFRLAGRVPLRGEIVVHPEGHEFEVIDADPRRIKRLRVRVKTGAAFDRAAE